MDLFYDPKKIKFWIYDYIEIINKKRDFGNTKIQLIDLQRKFGKYILCDSRTKVRFFTT